MTGLLASFVGQNPWSWTVTVTGSKTTVECALDYTLGDRVKNVEFSTPCFMQVMHSLIGDNGRPTILRTVSLGTEATGDQTAFPGAVVKRQFVPEGAHHIGFHLAVTKMEAFFCGV